MQRVPAAALPAALSLASLKVKDLSVTGSVRLTPSAKDGLRTVSKMADGPPPSPAHNDIWIATDVDTNGTCWQFRFNAKSTSSYKWEFVGGAPMQAGPSGSMTTTTTGYVNLTSGPQITVARGGDYLVRWGVEGLCSVYSGNTYFMQARPSFGGLTSGTTSEGVSIAWAGGPQGGYTWLATGRSPGHVVTIQMQNDRVAANTSQWQNGWLEVLPVRIS